MDQHRVTTETLASEETVFDDIAAPEGSPSLTEKREMQLQIESLRGHVNDLVAKLRERDMEVRKILQYNSIVISVNS